MFLSHLYAFINTKKDKVFHIKTTVLYFIPNAHNSSLFFIAMVESQHKMPILCIILLHSMFERWTQYDLFFHANNLLLFVFKHFIMNHHFNFFVLPHLLIHVLTLTCLDSSCWFWTFF